MRQVCYCSRYGLFGVILIRCVFLGHTVNYIVKHNKSKRHISKQAAEKVWLLRDVMPPYLQEENIAA